MEQVECSPQVDIGRLVGDLDDPWPAIDRLADTVRELSDDRTTPLHHQVARTFIALMPRWHRQLPRWRQLGQGEQRTARLGVRARFIQRLLLER